MRWWLMAVLAFTASACGDNSHDNGGRRGQNILFVVMDDVGIDQMRTFGYGGDTPARTPSIDAIAAEGILFRNTWSMPACSTSRGVFYTGRYPFRTNLYAALGPNDLANSQVSPFETTVPKLLAERGYESALFGKFHVGLQGHNPAGYGMHARPKFSSITAASAARPGSRAAARTGGWSTRPRGPTRRSSSSATTAPSGDANATVAIHGRSVPRVVIQSMAASTA